LEPEAVPLAAFEPDALVALAALEVVMVPAAAEVADPPIGAVDWPAISAETEELKVPLMPLRVNKWEKDMLG